MKCLNCGNEFEGKFCPECGQNAATGRYTLRLIMENLATAIMGRDGSVWFTIKSLFTRPGEMIVDNLNGKRKKYFSPFPMLFCVLTLYILITSFTSGFFITQSLTEAEKEILQDDQSQADPKGVEAFQLVSRSVRFLSDHYTLCYLLTLPLLVLMEIRRNSEE